MKKKKVFDLQDRCIHYAVRIIKLVEKLPKSSTGKYFSYQILRNSTSIAANYGEAQSAESRADFIHKLKLSLKKLRETEVWLKIIEQAEPINPNEKLTLLLKETDELISILFKSIETSKKKDTDEK
ncbi:MAG TPA: four helix bundle protein [Candidatus Cloacimonetes bacterium]|nr:four helix bundle protein [Candidatus Cloacimonadota bacterium]HEX38083.1 four helix bundle protein [Candidatus Cloacimonadota bacterium]